MGLVQQEPLSFNDTVYKNVAHGLVGSPWEKEEEKVKRELVKEACHEAFADEFIDRLPQVHRVFCKGTDSRLSIVGLQNTHRRKWDQTKRRATSETSDCQDYYQTALDPNPRRSD